MPPIITHTDATPRGSPKSETPLPSPSARIRMALKDQANSWDNQSNQVCVKRFIFFSGVVWE